MMENKLDSMELVRKVLIDEIHGAVKSIMNQDRKELVDRVSDLMYKGTDNMDIIELQPVYQGLVSPLKLDIYKKPALWILDNDGMSKDLILLAELNGDNAVILGTSDGLWEQPEYVLWDHVNMTYKHAFETSNNGDGTVYYATYGYYDADVIHDKEGYHIVVNAGNKYNTEDIEGQLEDDYGDNIMDIISDIDANRFVVRRAK